jgi:hypothetical protein
MRLQLTMAKVATVPVMLTMVLAIAELTMGLR